MSPGTNVREVSEFLERFAPLRLAASWDNVGLLVGSPNYSAARIITCLTVTKPVIEEAIEEQAGLIVAHHPLPFRALKELTTESYDGRRLLRLAAHRISVYSPHTAFDSAARGINQMFAEGLGLERIRPLIEIAGCTDPALGIGRWGYLTVPTTLAEFLPRVKAFLNIPTLTVCGSADQRIERVAVGCGSASDLIRSAAMGCECFVTGEASFHSTIEAQEAYSRSMALVLVGHYASERFGVERLAEVLQAEFATSTVWASRREQDPLRFA